MNYQETLDYLYTRVSMFQQVGSAAYKEGLSNTYVLDKQFGHPHREFRTIHVAGTNGKGSCSHTLAAILQEAGYRTGLYTSPHMLDFRERIRINGAPVEEEYVVAFIEDNREFIEELSPSFFELTTAMAFRYFADRQIDIAVVETGMGGRLDCTNIITPEVAVITNISYDHTQYLGDTLEKIAREKAGIIKPGVPVVIGETTDETKEIFIKKAREVDAPLIFAEEEALLLGAGKNKEGGWIYQTADYPDLVGELGGNYQLKNTNTLLSVLRQLIRKGFRIADRDVRNGFARVSELTGIVGRWQKIADAPLLVCDAAHNPAGIRYVAAQLAESRYNHLHIVLGMVNDKDSKGVLELLPEDAIYYFTKASVARALPETELQTRAALLGLQGESYPDVATAVKAAKKKSLPEDMIFVGGSSFIVADLLALI
ncbi:MAG: bifunctional folylpolyglutamate synthase/dihydrofolate synthase [Bacteroides sp.]|nr:bifunctional folylpolyglutamate synthase/dihydrofolate synthase [Bacteroides sp.]